MASLHKQHRDGAHVPKAYYPSRMRTARVVLGEWEVVSGVSVRKSPTLAMYYLLDTLRYARTQRTAQSRKLLSYKHLHSHFTSRSGKGVPDFIKLRCDLVNFTKKWSDRNRERLYGNRNHLNRDTKGSLAGFDVAPATITRVDASNG